MRVLVYLWAAPASLIGLVLSPFFATRSLEEGVLVCRGAPWLRKALRRYSAITLGHVILCAGDVSETTMRHERAHVAQYERWGPFFIPAYLIASAAARLRGGHHYLDNRFEVQAREAEEPGKDRGGR